MKKTKETIIYITSTMDQLTLLRDNVAWWAIGARNLCTTVEDVFASPKCRNIVIDLDLKSGDVIFTA